MNDYAVVRRTGQTHIQGLEEKTRGGEMNYARSACSALSRSVQWSTLHRGDDLQKALDVATKHPKGACKRCSARAAELLAA